MAIAPALARAVADPGRQSPLMVAATLADDQLEGEAPEDILELLAEHPSGAVRMQVRQALD